VLEWTQVQAAAREQREAVEAVLRRRELSPRLRERVEMVKAVAPGYGPEAIAIWSGRSVRTVAYWLERFVTSGLGALADAPRAGRPPRATPAYLAALEAAVSTPPRTLGLEFDVWTSERLSLGRQDRYSFRAESLNCQELPPRARGSLMTVAGSSRKRPCTCAAT
jgi:transposase